MDDSLNDSILFYLLIGEHEFIARDIAAMPGNDPLLLGHFLIATNPIESDLIIESAARD